MSSLLWSSVETPPRQITAWRGYLLFGNRVSTSNDQGGGTARGNYSSEWQDLVTVPVGSTDGSTPFLWGGDDRDHGRVSVSPLRAHDHQADGEIRVSLLGSCFWLSLLFAVTWSRLMHRL